MILSATRLGKSTRTDAVVYRRPEKMRKVRLVANSTDGVLFNSISVEMRSSQQGLGSALYTFAPIQFWLDLAKLDAVPEKRYEPGAPSGGPRYSREVIELAVESSSIALR